MIHYKYKLFYFLPMMEPIKTLHRETTSYMGRPQVEILMKDGESTNPCLIQNKFLFENNLHFCFLAAFQ